MQTLVRWFKLFLALFPSKLPTSFEQNPLWVNSILDLYQLPKDNDSYVNAIQTMIMQLGPTTVYKSKYHFARTVQKAMATQIAYEFVCQLREKHKKEDDPGRVNKNESSPKAV